MNSSRFSIKSNRSSSSQKGFRTLIKSRFNHSVKKIQKDQQDASKIDKNSVEQDKNQIKKYIKLMKLKKEFNSSSAFKHALSKNQMKKTKDSKYQLKETKNSRTQSKKNFNLLKKSFTQSYLKGQVNSPVNALHRVNIQGTSSTLIKQNQTQNNLDNNQSRIVNKQSQINQQYAQIIDVNNEISSSLNMNKMFLDLLQQKVSSLIKQKISNISQMKLQKDNKNVIILTKAKMFQKQISKILLKINQIREIQGEDVSSNIIVLDKKVKIIQRLIAQNMVESECLKDKYLNSLKKHRQACLNTSKSCLTNTYFKAKETNFKDKKLSKRNVTNQSTNNMSYSAPKNDQYAIPVHQTHFHTDKFKQPLPRSSYNRQYLNYKGVPKDILKKSKSNSLNIFNQFSDFKSKRTLRTSYQQDFMRKTTQKVDFKSLDCYKDKLTDLSISFNQRHNAKITNRQNPQQIRIKESQQLINNLKLSKKYYISTRYPSKYLISESRAVFNKKTKDQFEARVKSQIKHKNLNDLKYRYQKLVTLSNQVRT